MQISLFETLAYFNIGRKVYLRLSERSLKDCLSDSLPMLRKKLLLQLPGYIKKTLMTNLITNLPSASDRFEVTIRRRKAMEFAESGGCDHDGTHSIFGQIMQCLKKNEDANLKCFRVNSVDS